MSIVDTTRRKLLSDLMSLDELILKTHFEMILLQRQQPLNRNIQICIVLMDLSPIRQNFEKNRNRQKFHHSLKENPMFSKIAKFGCEML